MHPDTPEGLDRDLALFTELGADLAEIPVAGTFAIADGRLVRDRVALYRPLFQRHALRYTVHAPLALNYGDGVRPALHRAVGKAAVRFCGEIGAEALVVHSGWHAPETLAAAADDIFAREREALAILAEEAGEHGVTICLENMPVILDSFRGVQVNAGFDPAHVAAQVAVGDHADERSVFQNAGNAEALRCHGEQHIRHTRVGLDGRNPLALVHEIGHARELRGELSARVVLEEILGAEAALLHDRPYAAGIT